MDPKDRAEALVKTTASAMQEKATGPDGPPGAQYHVDQAEAVTGEGMATPKATP